MAAIIGAVILVAASIQMSVFPVTYAGTYLDNGFSSAEDYATTGNANSGVKGNAFVKQAATDATMIMTEDGVSFLRIASQSSGNAQVVGTFLNTADALQVSDKANANVDIYMQIRFRTVSGSEGIHFRIGGSAYRTVVELFINGVGNLCVKSSSNIVASGVNDGEWHVLTAHLKYDSSNDLFEASVDGGAKYSSTAIAAFSRTDAPIMTVLLLKEPNKGYSDIDYVRVSNGTEAEIPVGNVTFSYKDDTVGDGAIDHLYINGYTGLGEDFDVGIIFSDTEESCKFAKDGGDPLFARVAAPVVDGKGGRASTFLQSGCYGSSVVSAGNVGGEEDDDLIAVYWQQMPVGTLYARMFVMDAEGTVTYGFVSEITLTDGGSNLPIE